MREERLAQLKETIEITRALITMDIYYCIYDKDCVVRYMYPEDGDKDGVYVGAVFHDPTGKLEEVIATGKSVHNFLPMDRFGFAMEGNVVPVFDGGEICGAITTAYVPINQQQLAARELAMQSIYYLILSVGLKNNHCNRLYFNYETLHFPTDAQHFDDFCEKSIPDVHPEDVDRFREFTDLGKAWGRLQSKKTVAMECRLLDNSGEYRWTELIFTRIEELEANGAYDMGIYMVRDIHERKSKELSILQRNEELIEQLEKKNTLLFEQGMTDELTKLYNRKGLVWMGTSLLRDAREEGRHVFTLVADLNGLKFINDRYGHEEGDKAICTIAGLLRDCAPPSAIVCRTGGDEFTVMAALPGDSPLPRELGERLLGRMREYNLGSGLPYRVEASYGWDFRDAREIASLDDCVNLADKKMYLMKGGRSRQGHFSNEVESELRRRFGNARQSIVLLSRDPAVRKEAVQAFGDEIPIIVAQTEEEALAKLEGSGETLTFLVDEDLDGKEGLPLIGSLSPSLRKKAMAVLLAREEDEEKIRRAFELGFDDVMLRPFGTALNRCRLAQLQRVNIANQALGYLVDAHRSGRP